MARSGRPPADRNDSGDAQSTPVKVKAEKTKVKEEAKRDTGKRRAQEEPDADAGGADAEGDDDEQDEEQGGGSPKGRKRARANTNGDSRPAGGDDDDDDAPKSRVKTLPRDVDGFIPGSIVRIQLKNFVTYDYVEFRLGAYLNMIIGPNGTGKSTIACAICIGLNWPPATLGRANEVNLFVKQGTREGYIEIELKGPKGKPNLIIRRILKSDSKTSTFTLNGRGATGKEVSTQMAALNVQVGNLCSFLPQDKVSEFAAMTPQQLLRETQRAAGDSNLEQWHQTLIEEGTEFKKIADQITEDTNTLKQLRERNENIERDVQRYKERKKIEQDIKLLKVLIPVQEYSELRTHYMELKDEQRRLFTKVKTLEQRNEPAHKFEKDLEKRRTKLQKECDNLKRAITDKLRQINNKTNANEKFENDADDILMKIDNLIKEEKNRAAKIRTAESNIEKLRKELDKDVKMEEPSVITDALRQLRKDRGSVTDRMNGVRGEVSANAESVGRQERTIGGKRSEIRALENTENIKLRNLQNWQPDTAAVVLWLRANKHKFKMEVFEPPCLSVNVTNRAFAAAVEATVGNSSLTFVTQCKDDYNTFNRIVNDSPEVTGRRIRVTAWHRPQKPGMRFDPPCTREELKQLGFSGYVLDYVSYPEGLLWFLEVELHMHRVAVTLSNDTVDVKLAMDAVTRRDGANFITGNTMNMVSRSHYGRRLAQNMTRPVRPARNFAVASVDPEVRVRLERELKEMQGELGLYKEEEEALKDKFRALEQEDAGFAERAEDLRKRKEKVEQIVLNRTNLATRLTRSENEMKKLKAEPSSDQARARLRAQLAQVCVRRLNGIKEYRDLAKQIIIDQNNNTRMGLEYLQLGANIAALKQLLKVKDEKYQSALNMFNKVDAAFVKSKTDSKEALDRSRDAIDAADAEIKEAHQLITNTRNQYKADLKAAEQNGATPPDAEGVDLRTSEELDAELERQEAQLEITLNTNPGVMEEYEKRKRDIEQLDHTLQSREANRERVAKTIKKARDNWEPALRELVSAIGKKFSEAFDGIGCAGEIRVTPHESDYDKWAIDILVKFRDDEKLQLLTAQRQSGGERALTTILYLMSLTEQARAPFSLVDEINQGMDQRAERLVHNNMVRVTCKDDAGQYFLITPKLLPDLKYHERMKVLCVNNGEWLPEETGIGNMMSMVEGYVRARGGPNAL